MLVIRAINGSALGLSRSLRPRVPAALWTYPPARSFAMSSPVEAKASTSMPPWKKPTREVQTPVLRVYNSLTRSKVSLEVPTSRWQADHQLLSSRTSLSLLEVTESTGIIVDRQYTTLHTWATRGMSTCGSSLRNGSRWSQELSHPGYHTADTKRLLRLRCKLCHECNGYRRQGELFGSLQSALQLISWHRSL